MQIIDNRLFVTGFLVWLPLIHVQIVLRCIGIGFEFLAYIIKTFECANRSGSNGNSIATMGNEFLNRLLLHHDVFTVHLVVGNLLTLHRFESASSHMEREFLAVYTSLINGLQHTFGEVQTRRRCSHRTLDFGINRLISTQVTLLSFTIEIWGNRQFTHCFQHLGKRHRVVVP